MRATKIAAWAALAVLLGAAVALAADAENSYSCPSTCDSTVGCHCASSKVPGGLSPSDTPQFIVLTNDDAITVISQPIILNITERHTNKNGCKMPATWFVSIDYTDPNLVKQVFVRGHEIATHTVNHVADPDEKQIVGARDWLNKTAGIPKDKVTGFRAPYLIFNEEQRQVLSENGFRWDSSISEQYPSTTSPDANNRLWPYTMDYGLPQDCSISTGVCSVEERLPGLWEFPMWNIQDSTGMTVASMDPMGDPYELYKLQFDQRYSGNRAPLGIYIHAAWLIADSSRAQRLNDFLEYAMTHDNVFLVTVSQVLDWIQNPVPASQYSPSCPSEKELLDMLPEGTTLCVMPNEGCDYGTFDSSRCLCACQNEELNAGGYCRDAQGRCTVQKSYDFTANHYFCPVTAPPASANTTAASPAGATTTTDPAAGSSTVAPANTATSPLSVELDVSGTTVTDFQTKTDALCQQLLRLTGDAEAKCEVVSVTSPTARRLLQDNVHVIVRITTKNADATVAALKTDTVYTLLAPSGINVVPASVKAALGEPVLPTPAPGTEGATTDGTTSQDGTTSATEGGSSSGSNIGAIVGGVVGGIVGLAVIAAVVVVVMRRRKAAASREPSSVRTASFNPAFEGGLSGGVTATVTTSRSPTKKELAAAESMAMATSSPLRDSMVLKQ